MIAKCPSLFAVLAPRAFHLGGFTRRDLHALAADLQALRAQGAYSDAGNQRTLYTPAAIDQTLVAYLHGERDAGVTGDAGNQRTLYTPAAIDRSVLA